MNLSLAFKECYLAKILNLDTKAIAYLLFHTEEILDSVFIKKKKSKSSPKQPLLFGTRFVRQGFGWFISSSLLIGGLKRRGIFNFQRATRPNSLHVLSSVVVSIHMSFKADFATHTHVSTRFSDHS